MMMAALEAEARADFCVWECERLAENGRKWGRSRDRERGGVKVRVSVHVHMGERVWVCMCVNESGGRTAEGREGEVTPQKQTHVRMGSQPTQKIDFFPFLKNKKVFPTNEF